jgi:hypothetical protein
MTIHVLTRTFTFALSFWIVLASAAWGHSAEQGFILLLPTDIYITAGVLTVVASILLVSLMSPQISLRVMQPVGQFKSAKKQSDLISILATLFLFLCLWIGISGPRDPLGNILPLTIWIVWWICFTTVLPIFGNLWAAINPWTGINSLIFGGTSQARLMPASIGVWPAVVLLIVFNGFAIADIAPSDPSRLAVFVGVYWCFIFAGTMFFEPRDWLNRVECFTVFFRLVASLAPYQRGQFGFPGWATLKLPQLGLSHGFFCIAMLGTGSFDGLHETFWWLALVGINPLEFPGRSAVIGTSWLGLLTTILLLGIAFTLVIWIGRRMTSETEVMQSQAFPLFALSLIPIAFGYHIAHYLTSFLVGIQYVAISLSDPFASGANLLGLSHIRVTTGFLNDPATVRIIWLTQASAVVVSHVVAVIMAHCVATRLFKTKRDILLSQSALSVLMVGYTVFGLWLLAAPRGV